MEVEHDGLPISVTLIKPYSIDTPYIEHAKNYLANEPKSPPPVYAPEVVAKTILYCAEHSVRDVFAGGSGKVTSLLGRLAPRLTDKVMESMFDIQQSDRPEQDRTNSLYGPTEGLKERGGRSSSVFESSAYTQTSLHPIVTGAVVAMAGVAGLTIASLLRGKSSNDGQAGGILLRACGDSLRNDHVDDSEKTKPAGNLSKQLNDGGAHEP